LSNNSKRFFDHSFSSYLIVKSSVLVPIYLLFLALSYNFRFIFGTGKKENGQGKKNRESTGNFAKANRWSPWNIAHLYIFANQPTNENVIDANVELNPEPPLNPNTLSSLDEKKSLAEAELEFIANLYADPLMNKAQIQRIVESRMDHLTSGFVGILKEKVFSVLSNEQRPAEDLVELNAIFEILSKPFDGLDSEYRRLEAIKETPFLIHPVPYILNKKPLVLLWVSLRISFAECAKCSKTL